VNSRGPQKLLVHKQSALRGRVLLLLVLLSKSQMLWEEEKGSRKVRKLKREKGQWAG
jgi:hypothetical protein